MFSSRNQYWINIMNWMKIQKKFKMWNYLLINKSIIIDMNWRTIVFCSISVHCFTLKIFENFFISINFEIFRKRAFNIFNSKKLTILWKSNFCLWIVNISNFNNYLIHVIKCMIIFFNNWWNTSIIMILWMLTKWCFQTLFRISCIQFSLILSTKFLRW